MEVHVSIVSGFKTCSNISPSKWFFFLISNPAGLKPTWRITVMDIYASIVTDFEVIFPHPIDPCGISAGMAHKALKISLICSESCPSFSRKQPSNNPHLSTWETKITCWRSMFCRIFEIFIKTFICVVTIEIPRVGFRNTYFICITYQSNKWQKLEMKRNTNPHLSVWILRWKTDFSSLNH